MAKAKKGILGDISGSIGPVNGSFWKGIPYLRTKPKGSNKPPTEKQLEHLTRFGACSKFISSIRLKVINPIWEPLAEYMNGFDLFMKTNINSFNEKGELIGFSDLKLSDGKLPLPDNISVTVVNAENRKILVTWDCRNLGGCDSPVDRLQIFLLNGKELIDMNNISFSRISGQAIVALPETAGNKINLYIFFRNLEKNLYSESVWFFVEFPLTHAA
jgi:hypothetical protein